MRSAAGQNGTVLYQAELAAPVPVATLYPWVADLGRYPQWLDLVAEADPEADAADAADAVDAVDVAWAVTLTARLGPLAPRVRRVLGLNLRTLAAVLAGQAFYAGNDTAALNIAAAVGLRGYGLFGATPVLHHSGHIVPVVPPGGYSASDGMARIPVGMVLDAIAADRQRVGPP